jgi:hypothetical protein
MRVIGKYPESKSSFGQVGQVLRNAATVEVKSGKTILDFCSPEQNYLSLS